VKAHNKPYKLDRSIGSEKASTSGKQLTITVTRLTDDTIYYRLLSSSNPAEYHYSIHKNSRLKSSHFSVNQSYGINTLNRHGSYLWMSTFDPMSPDIFTLLNSITEDTLLDLLALNDFRTAQLIYDELFELDNLTPFQQLFMDDLEDVHAYWTDKNDFRSHFIQVERREIDSLFTHLVDTSGAFNE